MKRWLYHVLIMALLLLIIQFALLDMWVEMGILLGATMTLILDLKSKSEDD